MARNDPRQITGRPQLDSSQSANVGLNVNDWQSMSSRANSAMWQVSDALSRAVSGGVSQTLDANAKIDRMRGQYDKKQGEIQRQLEDTTGASAIDLAEKSPEYKQGYKAYDGFLKARSFHEQALKDMQGLDTDTTDFPKWLQEKTAAFVESSGDLDPDVKAGMMPALERAGGDLREKWVEKDIAETAARQQDAAYGISYDAIKSGSIFQPGGWEKLYSTLGTKAFGALDKPEVTKQVAKALIDALSNGNIGKTPEDIDKVMDFLRQKHADGSDGIAKTGTYGPLLDNAAEQGKHVLKEREKEAYRTLEADNILPDYQKYTSGAYGPKQIDQDAIKYGRTDDPAWKMQRLGWYVAGQQARQAAAASADKDDQLWQWMQSGDGRAMFLSDEDRHRVLGKATMGAVKGLDEAAQQYVKQYGPENGLRMAAAAGNKSAANLLYVSDVAEKNDTAIPMMQARFSHLDPKDSDTFARLAEEASLLSAHSPTFLSKNLTSAQQATYNKALYLHTEMGLSWKQAAEKIANAPEIDPDVVNKGVAAALKNYQSKLPEAANAGFVQQRFAKEVREAMSVGADMDTAAKQAIDRINAHSIKIGNRLLPDYGLPKRAGAAMTAYLDELKPELVKANIIGKDDELTAYPVPGDEGKFIVARASDLLPITDPKTGARDLRDPWKMTGLWDQYNHHNDNAMHLANSDIAVEKAKNGGLGLQLTPQERAAWDQRAQEWANKNGANFGLTSVFANDSDANRKMREDAYAATSPERVSLEQRAKAHDHVESFGAWLQRSHNVEQGVQKGFDLLKDPNAKPAQPPAIPLKEPKAHKKTKAAIVAGLNLNQE